VIFDAWQKSMGDLKRLVLFIIAVLLIIYALSGIYSISRNELGVHMRFGRIVSSSIPSGIHYVLPWPVDRIRKVPVREVRSLTLDTFADEGEEAYYFRMGTGLESYCITGDNNIINISFVIQYTYDNPAALLTGVLDPDRFLKQTTERIIGHTIAGLSVDSILTSGKRSIAEAIKSEANRELEDAQSGIRITFAELVNVSPPVAVQTFFDDVVNAKIDRERLINEAESYHNQHMPDAQGRAHEIVEQAHAYQNQVMTEAEGNAERFHSQLKAYLQDKELVRNRLWLDTLQRILYEVGQSYIVDTQNQTPRANLKIMIPR
jgi:membrane protease subunit HflK